MRIPQVLLATTAALVLAGSLAACSATSSTGTLAPTTSPEATSPAPVAASGSALDLVGTRWHVAGKDGTTVRFDGFSVTVANGADSTGYAWSAQGDQVLVGGGSSSLQGPVEAPWLTATTRVERTGEGWTLLGASGAATAHLTPDGTVAATTATTLLGTAKPGSGVIDRPANALDGRWTAAGDATAAITFAAGTWNATSSCRTGAVGGRGAYRVLGGGRLLVVRTTTPIRGCPIVDGATTAQAAAITTLARAASFRIQDDTLTLFDRAGTVLGSLTRG